MSFSGKVEIFERGLEESTLPKKVRLGGNVSEEQEQPSHKDGQLKNRSPKLREQKRKKVRIWTNRKMTV